MPPTLFRTESIQITPSSKNNRHIVETNQHKPSPYAFLLSLPFHSMAAKGNGVDNPTLSPAIDGQSSGSVVQQEEPKRKDLVSELFKDPDAFKFALE